MDASLGAILSKVGEGTKRVASSKPAFGAAREHGRQRTLASVRLPYVCARGGFRLIWYVKHRLRDRSVETFRCDTEAKAHAICRELSEADEVAWVEDEQGRTVKALGPDR